MAYAVVKAEGGCAQIRNPTDCNEIRTGFRDCQRELAGMGVKRQKSGVFVWI